MQSLTNEIINDNTGLTAEEAEARRLAQLRARLNSRELAEEFARLVVARGSLRSGFGRQQGVAAARNDCDGCGEAAFEVGNG